MDNRLEMGVNKCIGELNDGVMRRNNGATRIVGFMKFGVEIESAVWGLGTWRREMPWVESSWSG